MKKRYAYVIQITLLLVILSGLITGCAGLSSAPTPPDSPTKKEPRIPYGTYVYDVRIYTSTITLNSDGTYMTDGFSSLSKDVGEYNITSDHITFISEANKKSDRYKYRYSDQFKCLYIYLIPDDDNPRPFYKR